MEIGKDLAVGDYANSIERENVLIKLWIKSYSSPNTRSQYSRYLKKFISTMNLKSLKEARTSHINVYLRLMLTSKSKKTVALYRTIISSALDYLVSVDYLDSNKASKAQKIAVPKDGIYKIFSEEHAAKMVSVATGQDRAMVILLYYTIARISEILNLTLSDFIVDTKWATIKITGKGGKIRRVKIPVHIYDEVISCLFDERHQISNGVINPNEPLFISSHHTRLSRSQAWRRYKKVAKAAGLPEQVAPHWSRHSGVTHAIKNGASLKATKDMAGHGSIETTALYQNIDDDKPPSDFLSNKLIG